MSAKASPTRTPGPLTRVALAYLAVTVIVTVVSYCAPEAYAATVAVLRSGGMARVTTTLSLAGAMMVTFDLVGQRGDVVNLGAVESDGPAPTMN